MRLCVHALCVHILHVVSYIVKITGHKCRPCFEADHCLLPHFMHDTVCTQQHKFSNAFKLRCQVHTLRHNAIQKYELTEKHSFVIPVTAQRIDNALSNLLNL